MLRVIQPPDISAPVPIFPQLNHALLQNAAVRGALLKMQHLMLCLSLQVRTLCQ